MNIVLYCVGWVGSIIGSVLLTKRIIKIKKENESDMLDEVCAAIKERAKAKV